MQLPGQVHSLQILGGAAFGELMGQRQRPAGLAVTAAAARVTTSPI
ncbi:MAG: hypothetical protein U0X20_33485 [Caldilineaceae bacterium]